MAGEPECYELWDNSVECGRCPVVARCVPATARATQVRRARIEGARRDEALDSLSATRQRLISRAFNVAVALCRSKGTVCSEDVFAEMRKDSQLATLMASVDPRWMGPVFRRRCWRRVGWKDLGSHCRPIAVWELRPGATL